MSFEYISEIPSVDEVVKQTPLAPELKKVKDARALELSAIFEGRSDKFLVIMGPCSSDNEDSVCDYVGRLSKLQDRVRDKIFIVPRIYTNKPRTTGEGYKGMAHQPDPAAEPDILAGVTAIRRLHVRVLQESGLVAADEMLYPSNFPYLADLLGYVAVGARSVENQHHRLTASGLDIPVGMKNPTSGDLGVMLNSVKAAQLPHEFIYNGWEVRTPGNPLAHTILRGLVTPHGRDIPNYHYEDLRYLCELYMKRDLEHRAVIVDCNHANSGKKFAEQPRIAREVLRTRRHSEDLKTLVKGLMIESYLVEGTQKVSEGTYGKSITDPCLGWEASEALILELADTL